MAGYSSTPLIEKLGIKERMELVLLNAPEHFLDLLGRLPPDIIIKTSLDRDASYIQFFTTSKAELEQLFFRFTSQLKPNGSLWICWPKGGSGVETDLNENTVREIGLENGVVDVKVCAIDDSWSGLKFVFRLKDR